ncbi:hypothetical protein JW998_11260, partial [candidate division KSB1 bacterium]|nr:hypothetical protein [candidate division KSB1 bacterium]
QPKTSKPPRAPRVTEEKKRNRAISLRISAPSAVGFETLLKKQDVADLYYRVTKTPRITKKNFLAIGSSMALCLMNFVF